MQRIAIDMDGVLSDTVLQFIAWEQKETGITRRIEELMGKPELEVFPNSKKHLHTEGFFRTTKIIGNSQSVVEELNKKYNVYIVSAATEFPKSLIEKQAWLNEFFPFITWQQMVFCGSKDIIQADIMIDDHFKNLDSFSGELSILFTQPHNAHAENGRHRRVHNWDEIASLLL
ncbi:MAG: 5'(3')-deoxyribonucleotidase [Chitinophagaceae bacterium]|nr:MAG: 5'(3')-deoxyribonucleotidase [Chitinophagaceae bacterium]